MSHISRSSHVYKQNILAKAIRSALLISLPLGFSSASLAATFTVNTLLDTEDATPGDGNAQDSNGATSLRAAITEANALAGADNIVFDPALVANGDATIQLTLFDTGVDSGELGPSAFLVNSEVTITGPTGDNGITVENDSSDEFRFFHVTSAGNLTLENLTFTGGVAQGGHGGSRGAGGGGAAGIGGAIVNEGSLTITASTLANNQALGGSGGVGSTQIRGGSGGGGVGADGADGGDLGGGAGGNPNGGTGNGGAASGTGGGGAGGNGNSGPGGNPRRGGDGGAGNTFGGGGAGGSVLATGGGSTRGVGGDAAAGGFGGGGGGGGKAISFAQGPSGGAGANGGFAAGNGTNGGTGNNGVSGHGGGGGGLGGAIFNYGGTATITNSTISGNTATGGSSGGAPSPYGGYNLPLGPGHAGDGYGGAVFNLNGNVTITSSTIAENTVAGGQSSNNNRFGTGDGAIFNLGDGATATLTLTNTLVADTQGGDDFVSVTINSGTSTTSGVGNLIEVNDGFAGTIVTSTDPNLAALADNRGPTLTHALPTGSSAVDAGDNASVGSLTTDQRGGIFNRIADGDLDGTATIDIGAFELALIDYGDAPDFAPGDGPFNVLFEQGNDDFRISSMGNDAETDPNIRDNFFGFDAQVAYNATANEFFVVWEADDDTGSLVDNEVEIYGQRINASTGALLGSRIRISTMGPDGSTAFRGNDPGVAWNSTTNQYLVVWEGDDDTAPLVDNEQEIFGRLINANGTPAAAQFRISAMGNDAETDPTIRDNFRAEQPHVVYNATSNQFLVVWVGDDDTAPLVDNELEVFGRRVNADGSFPGSQFRISEMGPNGNISFRANDPRVGWNSTNNNYMVTWVGDDDTGSLVDNEQEAYNRVVGNDEALGTQTRVSFMGTDGVTTFGPLTFDQPPDLAYNPVVNEFLIVWTSDQPPTDNKFEIFGRRVNAQTGALLGAQINISDIGLPGNASFDAQKPVVAYNADSNSYFVVYQANEDDVGKTDIYGRRVSAAGVVLDSDEVRVSHMGMGQNDIDFDGFTPAIAFNSTDQRFLVAWQGDDDTAPLVNGETEIFGQLIDDLGIVDYSTLGANNGPAHRQANGIFIGALLDDDPDGQPSLNADGDDNLNTDDEDGVTPAPVEFSGTPMIDVTVTNTTGNAATLYGWIDYDADGIFETTERASIAVPDGSNNATVTLTFPAVPTSPAPATDTFARFRLSTDAQASDPTGLVDDGEVEDYPAILVADTTPDQFTFTDVTDVALNTVQTSNTITVSGIDAAAAITVTNGEYSINGGAFTSAAGAVNDGDMVQVRHTSSGSFSTAVDTTLDIGGVSDVFTSTTLAEDLTPDQFTFTDVTDVPLSTEQVSNTITVSGVNSTPAITVTNGEYSINGGAFTSAAGTVSDGDTVTVRHTSSNDVGTDVDTILDIGGVTDTFTSTTIADDGDGIPTSVEDMAPNNGDGNFDTIPDRNQINVASLPNATTGDYITLEVSGACGQIDLANTLTEPAFPPDPLFDYPLGLLNFELPCTSADLTVFYHGQNEVLDEAVYRKFGPEFPTNASSITYYTLSGVTFGLNNGVMSATFSLSDGVQGDDNTATGANDDRIIDPSGPAVAADGTGTPPTPTPPQAIPVLQPWGIGLLTMLLGGLVARFGRRRT